MVKIRHLTCARLPGGNDRKIMLNKCMIDIDIYTARMFKATRAVCLDGEKLREKGASVTVAHCSTFRLFMVNIVLS